MIKGYPSSQKGAQNYQTLQPIGNGKHASDTIQRAYADYAGVDLTPEATSTGKVIDLAGHSVLAGDMIRFVAGPLRGVEVTAVSVETNSIVLAHDLGAVTAADLFRNFRSTSVTVAQDGGISATTGPIQFVLNTVPTQVVEDTVTPTNNVFLPVKDPDTHTALALLATEVKQDTIIAELQESNKTIHRVGGSFAASQALTTTGVSIATVAASKVATEIEISYKAGDPISLHDASTGGNLLGYISSGGGVVKLNDLAAGAQIYARRVNSDVTVADLMVNLNGKDA